MQLKAQKLLGLVGASICCLTKCHCSAGRFSSSMPTWGSSISVLWRGLRVYAWLCWQQCRRGQWTVRLHTTRNLSRLLTLPYCETVRKLKNIAWKTGEWIQSENSAKCAKMHQNKYWFSKKFLGEGRGTDHPAKHFTNPTLVVTNWFCVHSAETVTLNYNWEQLLLNFGNYRCNYRLRKTTIYINIVHVSETSPSEWYFPNVF